ncbi:MAG: hypothetical protein LBC19_15340 [Tannerella sp.]|nr:hypothetical protein [Tannerella sp.]
MPSLIRYLLRNQSSIRLYWEETVNILPGETRVRIIDKQRRTVVRLCLSITITITIRCGDTFPINVVALYSLPMGGT